MIRFLALWLAAGVAGLLAYLIAPLLAVSSHRGGWRVLVAMDQALNAATGGSEDETISSRAGKCARRTGRRPCVVLCKILHLFDRNHCERVIEVDEGRIIDSSTGSVGQTPHGRRAS